jgi:hypothetical protein
MGTGVQVPESAWQHPSWKLIDFSIDGPQDFAYEFVTAKDRKSAVVKAHAKLGGDGTPVLIEATLTMQRDGTVAMTVPTSVGASAPATSLIGP